jgi:hypothetical protein
MVVISLLAPLLVVLWLVLAPDDSGPPDSGAYA